jgi:hypothetical protein
MRTDRTYHREDDDDDDDRYKSDFSCVKLCCIDNGECSRFVVVDLGRGHSSFQQSLVSFSSKDEQVTYACS